MIRAVGTIVVVSLLALGAFAATASAEPLSMTFTEDRANVGVQLSDDASVRAARNSAVRGPDRSRGRIDLGGRPAGSPVLDPSSTPIDADVAVDFEIGTIAGDFTQATGALTLSGTAGGTLTGQRQRMHRFDDPARL